MEYEGDVMEEVEVETETEPCQYIPCSTEEKPGVAHDICCDFPLNPPPQSVVTNQVPTTTTTLQSEGVSTPEITDMHVSLPVCKLRNTTTKEVVEGFSLDFLQERQYKWVGKQKVVCRYFKIYTEHGQQYLPFWEYKLASTSSSETVRICSESHIEPNAVLDNTIYLETETTAGYGADAGSEAGSSSSSSASTDLDTNSENDGEDNDGCPTTSKKGRLDNLDLKPIQDTIKDCFFKCFHELENKKAQANQVGTEQQEEDDNEEEIYVNDVPLLPVRSKDLTGLDKLEAHVRSNEPAQTHLTSVLSTHLSLASPTSPNEAVNHLLNCALMKKRVRLGLSMKGQARPVKRKIGDGERKGKKSFEHAYPTVLQIAVDAVLKALTDEVKKTYNLNRGKVEDEKVIKAIIALKVRCTGGKKSENMPMDCKIDPNDPKPLS